MRMGRKSSSPLLRTPRPGWYWFRWQVSWLVVTLSLAFPDAQVQWHERVQTTYSCGGSTGIRAQCPEPVSLFSRLSPGTIKICVARQHVARKENFGPQVLSGLRAGSV